MNQRVQAFCDLIEFLHASHAQWTRDTMVNPKQRKLYEEVSRSFRVVEERKLAQLLRMAKAGDSVDFLAGGSGSFLFLRPPEDAGALLPVLSLKSDFGKSELRV